ncbi:hypothetical protein H5397_11615 [Propioniciclava sp. MC1683]|uniref:hypothetical protein n=1 Tax=Propioniciclava sp. MC1683 TaxID=2760309 RepID=UPI0015FED76F|nr:hypothetical protein [Propioniciclava sp. MC1683]MBB1502063.1 hypothetical protein [Propioniciclava sp. MC1683]
MTNPITTTPRRSKAFGLLLKAAVVIPDLIIASLLWLMILALLPPAVAFLATILGITSAALAATGLGADAVVRVLYRARRPTASEAPRLAVAWRIAIHHSDTSDVTLRIVTHGPPIATGGRRHLLMRRDIVDAYVANGINAHQMAALIAQGIGRLRSGHTRFDLLWTIWTIPWDIIRGLARAIGHRLVWIPLVQFAWRMRFLVGLIALVLEAQAGRWVSLIVIAAFLTFSYAMPFSRRAWEEWLTEAAQPNPAR